MDMLLVALQLVATLVFFQLLQQPPGPTPHSARGERGSERDYQTERDHQPNEDVRTAQQGNTAQAKWLLHEK